MDSQSASYAPMNRFHIPSFPNLLPHIDWKYDLPKFNDDKGDDDSLHLVKFHMHIRRLGVEFHEDCLMKMFMVFLAGKAISWYEKLASGIFQSPNDFHSVFFEQYKDSYPYLLLVENCCKYVESFIQYMEIIYGDEEFMDE